jgi:serine protease AprX
MSHKFDYYLNNLIESTSSDSKFFVRIRIIEEKEFVTRTSRTYKDEYDNEREYEVFKLRQGIQDRIFRLSERVLVKNFDLVPGMAVEMTRSSLYDIQGADFVESLELSKAALLNLNDTLYNISIPKFTRNQISSISSKVSIIDTGFDTVKGSNKNIISSMNFTNESNKDNYIKWDTHGHVLHGHGSVIANIISDISPNSKFLNFKSIHSNFTLQGSAQDQSYVEKSIDESIINNANVINISLGFQPCIYKVCSLCDSVNRAVKIGANVVVAAGNNSRRPPEDPGQAEDAITVGACTKPGYMWDDSNIGPTNFNIDKPDVVAPGSGLLINCPIGGQEYRTGTSISTAIVSAIVTFLRNKNPDPYKVKQSLVKTATELKDPEGKVYDKQIQGAGRINVDSAYNSL